MDTPATFHIRELPVYGDLILAPMDGFSDLPFRSMARRLGSALSYTEFVNAMDVVNGHPLLDRRLTYLEEERPVVYQLFDDQPERMIQAAHALRRRNPDILDVNMGCSARTVYGRGAGAGLLCTPEKIAEIFRRLTTVLDIPITGKIRLGWDTATRNYLDIARIIQDNGGSLIAVHGRTKSQTYADSADWDAIAEVAQAVRVPVIANGDVRTVADIERIKAHTGCAAVMIGRGAIGNPWIFSRLDRDQIPPERVRADMRAHLQSSLDFYGQELGLVLFRKHAVRYLRPHGLEPELRARLFTAPTPEEFIAILDKQLGAKV